MLTVLLMAESGPFTNGTSLLVARRTTKIRANGAQARSLSAADSAGASSPVEPTVRRYFSGTSTPLLCMRSA